MPYHILIVDDDEYFRSEFRELLHEHTIIEAPSGEELINILKHPHNIDLIVLDYNLPGVKGTQLLPEIKTLSPDVKTVMLTGQSSINAVIEALRGQADEFIEKPLNEEKLKILHNLILSSKNGEKDVNHNGTEGKVEQAKLFAQRNYDKKLTLEDVADEIGVTPKYLSRIFKEHTGVSFTEYKLNVKITKAKELLENSGNNIEEISYKLGYQNTESFNKVFKQYTGATPSDYREQAKQKNEMPDLNQLTSTVAHELRRPLNVIQSATMNIKEKVQDTTLDNNIDSIEKMVKQGEQLINNILTYSKLTNPVYRRVLIKDLLEEAITTTQKLFLQKQKQVKINKHINHLKEVSLNVDPVQIKSVITNILVNAYDAVDVDKGGVIEVKAGFENGFIIVEIMDNGKGIAVEELEKVFHPYYTNKPKGTGLGLAICREVINLHGGEIKIESELDKGTRVSISIPVS